MNLEDNLFLFDIDGTIIDTGGDGKKSIISALEESLQIKIKSDVNFLGGIDILFFKEFYNKKSLPLEKINYYWNKFKNKYIENMKLCFNNQWIIFPNSFHTIKYLSENSNISLATGNMKIGAEIKLEKFGLNQFFNCGGYGDIILNRSEIVKESIKSSEDYYKKKFNKNKIFLFGDTQKDIQSALENEIIPVLIDYKNINYKNAKKWKAKYYGNFNNFDNFLNKINSLYEYSDVIYF